MSRPTWAVELEVADSEEAQALRLVPGVEARYTEDRLSLWLRGSEIDADTLKLVQSLPCKTRMNLLPDGRGIVEGKSVPSISLTGAGWLPLRHLSTLRWPDQRRAGTASPLASLRLVPASVEEVADVLCVPFVDWHDYVITAPAIRLTSLRFAVSEDRRAMIHGTPLPPLLGDFYVYKDGIAIPAGWMLFPAVEPELLARHFRLNEGDLFLFHHDQPCELIAACDFTQASRSSVRETAAALEAMNR